MYVFGGNSPTYNVDKHHGIWRFLWGVSNSHIWWRFPWPWTELNYWVWNHYIELWKIGFNKPLDLKSSKQAIGRNHPSRNSPFVLHFISQIRVIPISQSHLVVVHGGTLHHRGCHSSSQPPSCRWAPLGYFCGIFGDVMGIWYKTTFSWGAYI